MPKPRSDEVQFAKRRNAEVFYGAEPRSKPRKQGLAHVLDSKRLHHDYNWSNLVNREFRLHSGGSGRLSQTLTTPVAVNFDQMFRDVIEEFAS